ncbi:MAG TPA: UxaA family hydrolase [Anaerolineae bacterium]|nr:UxaA family hydrolase [Anaerolineae bacterium]
MTASAGLMSDIFSLEDIARLPAPNDNAVIATRRLPQGTRVKHHGVEFVLDYDVLEGHRFAVQAMAADAPLLSWGYRFGIATREIAPGNYVVNASTLAALRERNVTLALPDSPNFRNQIERYQFDESKFLPGIQLAPYVEPRTFLGYRRAANRGVGTRNVIVILGLSSRAASYARALAIRCEQVRAQRAREFENIDRIAAVAHTEGSGNDPLNNYELLLRTLAGMMVHPNVGAVLAVEHPEDQVTARGLRAYMTEHDYRLDSAPHDWLTLGADLSYDLQRGAEIVNGWLEEVNQTARTPESLAHLKVALQCGGSDAFSGVSGNPLEGAVAREIVRYGGSANLGETDELIGAEEYILKNVRDAGTAREFLEAIEKFKARLGWHGVSPEGNPSGGNLYRGLYNIALKSLGAAMKKDPAMRLDDVIVYGERMTAPGFYFMDSPGNDLEGIAGQVAAGCNLIFFTTGNGSITNFPFVPTIKIVTTTGRYNLLSNEMDVNAGAYLDGTPLPELTRATLDLTVRIASGEPSKGEQAAHSQVSIWRNWRQTESRRANVMVELPAPSGEPIPLRANGDYSRPLSFPIRDDSKHRAHEFVGLILPTSLCAAEIARRAADQMNETGLGQPEQLARFVTLTHTEGCGAGGDSYLDLYKRTMLNYMQHPMVRFGLFLEHGCEITHNDSMRRRLREMGGDPTQFGWASIQLDGGIEKVLRKIEEWFAARMAEAEVPVQDIGRVDLLRIGLMAEGTPMPEVAAALALLTRNIVSQGGTVVLPSTSALLEAVSFREYLLNGRAVNASLAYGQFAARRGFHIMDAPSTHWVETLSGLGATGVELIVAYINHLPQQVHPFVPVLQFAYRERWGNAPTDEFDLIVDGSADEIVRELEQAIQRVLAGEVTQRADLKNSDFQITRAQFGVSV